MCTQASTSFEEPYPFHLVEFVNRGPKPKKKKIDIVATKWLGYNEVNKKAWVYFPSPPYNEETSKTFDRMLSLLQDPLHTWKKYTVKIKGRAKTYAEALSKASQLQEKDSVMTLESGESSTEVEARAAKKIKQDKLRAISDSMKNPVFASTSAQASNTRKNYELPRSDTVVLCNTVDELMQQKEQGEECFITNNDDSNESGNTVMYTKKGQGLNKTCSSSNSPGVFPFRNITNYTRASTMNEDQNLPRSNTMDSSNDGLMRLEHKRGSYGQRNRDNEGRVFDRTICDIENIMIDYLAKLLNDIAEVKQDIKEMKQDIKNFKSQKKTEKAFVGCVQQIGEKYKYRLPFFEVEEFESFDENLKTSASLKDDVCTVLQTGLDPALIISKSIVSMLKMFLSKDVANQYVAIKKSNNKKVMKTTSFFNCVELVIKERRKLSNLITCDKEMLSSLSSVLSNSCSWKNGTLSGNETVNVSRKRSNTVQSIEIPVNEDPLSIPKRMKTGAISNEPLVIATGTSDQQNADVLLENIPIILQNNEQHLESSFKGETSDGEEEYSDEDKKCSDQEKEYSDEKWSSNDEGLNDTEYVKKFQR